MIHLCLCRARRTGIGAEVDWALPGLSDGERRRVLEAEDLAWRQEQAREQQAGVMRELYSRAFPEPDVVADDAPASIEQVRLRRRRQAAASEAAALRRARAERDTGTTAAIPQSAPRRRTA
ncbi:hypothetical protein ACFCXH_00225 [Streptomyces nojiriensis]|uniref:hypothetical protein n=1 Tax=Streptomyces nojiriensis TaxID=66374 RepID=UPI0035DF523C